MSFMIRVNQLDDLDEVIRISKIVFDPTPRELEEKHNKEDWLQKVNNNGQLITAWDGENMIEFAISYPKEGNFHIWNVGVLKEYHKQGIWKMVYDEIEKNARERGFPKLTLNAYKAKFPGMYNFALKNGFIEYKTEGEKSYFSKEIK